MRVVQVIPAFSIGGTEKAGCVLAEGLARAGCEAHVVGRKGGVRFREDPPPGVTHHVFEEVDNTAYARAIVALQPDVVHLHWSRYDEPLINAIADEAEKQQTDLLLVVTPVFGRPPQDRGVLDRCHTCLIGIYMLYRLRLWLGMSAEEAMRHGIGVVRINSFEQTEPPQSTLDPPEIALRRREELGIPADAFVAGRLGRDTPGKWSPKSPEIVSSFLEQDPKNVWLSVGYPSEGRGREQLQQRWGKRFVNLAETADFNVLAKALSTMDVQIFFSPWGECFSTIICEAAGCGLPTIAGVNPLRDNGQTEQIIDDYNGYLVATPKQAMERAARLASSPEHLRTMKQQTYDYAHARWTTDKTIEQLLSYYEACRANDPLATDYFQCILKEEQQFSARYRPQMVDLLADNPLQRARWKLTLSAVADWRWHQLARRFRSWIR